MSSCIYCIDNDIVKKLATFQLFDNTLKLFDASYEQVNILETAKYKFEKDWKNLEAGKRQKTEDRVINYKQVLYLTRTLENISEADIDQEIFIQLSSIENIDQGEAIITSHAIKLIQKNKSTQIFTGDKRFIKALAKVNLPIIQQSLSNRLWCLEQLVLKNIQAYGFETIRDLIVPVRECDTQIKAVFGSGLQSASDNSLATLKDSIQKLREEAGNLLNTYN
ncbi:MAG: hypothetical protein JGK17_18275 [Microcoleus sp. PH2017_10_PVI_O_A]|uniref:hypothetical protein n=1 Tax=unclassified Microcoleus TaxID=2642155 RepID=UPI001D913748|nr:MULTISPECIES: hypothetical protein [unclassified Microcoleus]TAE79053.1 MAG: hypothetical protein EAZ83_22890 [Oscillatoriales cyanobacterium]MCC3407500.1 hypothetical protein [Microcoleus sp. PH2017_10_PVI_O_A]MCC3461568.1 hypothetical protein [Microcoleus sp. PH2017_11_PCY_U_A]MCC3480055.1 hypothetical protein [Microcoleus sp. PH2017_12_PCY_D_A]MCC3529761.1 hypothetical protein [Microcoleus sp. PH2017_21_RUC_O_A]